MHEKDTDTDLDTACATKNQRLETWCKTTVSELKSKERK